MQGGGAALFAAFALLCAGEARAQQRVDRALGSLGVPIEVKNQARVHLWYREHFGHAYPPLAGVKDGVDRFLVPSTSVAVRPLGNTYEAYVPNGLSILYALRTASGDTRAPGNR